VNGELGVSSVWLGKPFREHFDVVGQYCPTIRIAYAVAWDDYPYE
jgi:hypothetical protein